MDDSSALLFIAELLGVIVLTSGCWYFFSLYRNSGKKSETRSPQRLMTRYLWSQVGTLALTICLLVVIVGVVLSLTGQALRI